MEKLERKWFLPVVLSLLFLSRGLAQQDSSRTDLSAYFAPQKIRAFSDFLFEQRDYLRAAAEYQRYLFLGAPERKHHILYRIGQCLFSASRPEQSVDYFRKAAEFKHTQAFQDSAKLALITALFSTSQYAEFRQKIESFQERDVSPGMKTRLAVLQAGYYMREKEWEKAHSFLTGSRDGSRVQEDDPSFRIMTRFAERGIHLPRKSPLLAGVMSSIIPGTG